jgi:hypothetical protein
MAEPKDPKESKESKRTIRQKVEAFAAGQQVQKLQAHWKAHQREYLIGGGCLVVGYLLRRPQAIAPVFNNSVAPVFTPEFNNTIKNVVNNGGHMRKIVRCLETDEMWPSVSKAAEATGNTLHAMSRHLNGHTPDLSELHFVIEGLATG